jgi:hypothetical protein
MKLDPTLRNLAIINIGWGILAVIITIAVVGH